MYDNSIVFHIETVIINVVIVYKKKCIDEAAVFGGT